jgi:hypothetical protein
MSHAEIAAGSTSMTTSVVDGNQNVPLPTRDTADSNSNSHGKENGEGAGGEDSSTLGIVIGGKFVRHNCKLIALWLTTD